VGSWRVAKAFREPGTVSLNIYLRRLAFAYIWAVKAAWKGFNTDPSIHLDIALILLSGEIMLRPLGGGVNALVGKPVSSSGGGWKIDVTMSCKAETTAPVKWLARRARFSAILFYDLYIIRRRSSPLKVIKQHRHAWNQLRSLKTSD
jgi:hypothetical protein